MPLPPGPISREQAQALLDALMQRASTDREFRQLCLADGRAAAELVMDLVLPEELNVLFVETAAAGPGIVLPPFQDAASAEAFAGEPPKPSARGLNIKPRQST